MRIVLTAMALGALLAAVARPLAACSYGAVSAVRAPGETHLVVLPRADSVYVGRAGRLEPTPTAAWLRPGDFRRGEGAWKRVYGQRARVLRAGGADARRLVAGPREAVLVYWSTQANCGPAAWRGRALFNPPGRPAALTARLRPRSGWIGGAPTFDAHMAGLLPYPTAPAWATLAAEYGARGPWLTPEEYLSLFEALPVQSADSLAIGPLEAWVHRRPELAARFPAPLFIREARRRWSLEDPRPRKAWPGPP